jgi:hypothetical protein
MQQLPLFNLEARPQDDDSPHLDGEWYIPGNIIIAAIELMGAIDLDPYSNSKKLPNVPAKLHYTAADNGLVRPWGPKRRVFLNPPPTPRAAGQWITKLCNEYESGSITEAVALLNAVTDSDWWQRVTPYPVCFANERLKLGGKASTAPTAIVYLGPNVEGFADSFSEIGTIYMPFRRKALPTVPQVIQHGRYILTIHHAACYFTIANSSWSAHTASQDQERLRREITQIPEILPSRFNNLSRTREGTVKLVFSFERGAGEAVISRVEGLLAASKAKPAQQKPAKSPKPKPAAPKKTAKSKRRS